MIKDNFCVDLAKYSKSLKIKMKIENKSLNTIDAYNRTYKHFIEFCKQYEKELSLDNLKEDDIYAFIQYKSDTMNKQGDISVSTTNSLIAHLKRLFKHIERNSDKLYDFDKVFEDIKLKQPTKFPKGLSDSELKKLEKYIDNVQDNTDYVLSRNIFLLKLMLYGGMRASETISIRLMDITLDETNNLYKFTFIGKGNKTRTTYIKESIIKEDIDKFKNHFKIEKNKNIALSRTGNVMNRVRLSEAINVIYKRAGVKVSGVHILRHTAAKNLLKDNVSIVVVQSLLGHSSIQTTSIYANPTDDIIVSELGKI